ncbi:MAG: EamA family transporter RarD, partial [Pseudomonadota bacterium]|nr:EamA family transporter RarD [Pseudomonadota bacterium]
MGRLGIVYGLLAYGAWGLLPIYFKLLRAIQPMSIVALRVAFSMMVLIMLAWAARCWPKVRATLRDRRALGLLLASSALIAVNWTFYVYAVNSGHILAGSLGYYLNPFANILLGRFLLKERLSRLQWIAVAIAAVGIAVLAANALGQLWISLILCASFALYGFVRKVVAADALAGLTIENAMLVPFALTWLFYVHVPGTPPIAATAKLSFLVALAGIISTVPLLLFTAAARRLPYSTMGMLQFLAPTIQFLVAVFLYGEPFTSANAIAFAALWTALTRY